MATQPTTVTWVQAHAERERRRRAEAESFRQNAKTLQALLTAQVHADMQEYFAAFPNEQKYIETLKESEMSRIVRTRDEHSQYRGGSVEVQLISN